MTRSLRAPRDVFPHLRLRRKRARTPFERCRAALEQLGLDFDCTWDPKEMISPEARYSLLAHMAGRMDATRESVA